MGKWWRAWKVFQAGHVLRLAARNRSIGIKYEVVRIISNKNLHIQLKTSFKYEILKDFRWKMKKLFHDNDTFDFISLKRLAMSYLKDESERIELAGFQRGAAWKAANVEALWDSLLRWFPIGSILLARANEFEDVKSRPESLSSSAKTGRINQEKPNEDVYILVDGQQRSNAITLGFLTWDPSKMSEAGARLWIDLGEPSDRMSKQFEFYLCTADEPFGENITRHQKQQALEKTGKSGVDDSELSLNETYPARAIIPVPFAEFVQAIKIHNNWQNTKDCLLEDDYIGLTPITLDIIKGKFSSSTLRSDIDDLLQRINDVILDEKYSIPAILFRNRDNQVSSKELFKLFERININGVTPPQAELFYSVLKLHWPEIGNYVAEISEDSELQGLLKPTEIILAALRLVNPEITELSLSIFERITVENRQLLLEILEPRPGSESLFHYCMKKTFQTLKYLENGDIGLPRQLIQRMRQRVWHTILYWIYKNKSEFGSKIGFSDRLNIIRFALLDMMDYFIFTGWWRGYSQYVNNRVFDRRLIKVVSGSDKFPTKEIYQEVKKRLVEDGVPREKELKIISPEEYKEWIAPIYIKNDLNWNSQSGGNVLLLYSQRLYLDKWEKLNDLDKDHIIPNNWMNFRGPVRNIKFWKVENVNTEGRSPVINSPGNFRFWPSTLNRIYQDIKPSSKHIHFEDDVNLDTEHNSRNLNTVRDILDASFIDLEELDMIHRIEIMKINNDNRVWTTEKYNLFKQFVDHRCYRMYRNLYETVKFDELED